MSPDFFELIGINAQGTAFEVCLAIVLMGIGGGLLGYVIREKWVLSDAWLHYLVGGVLLAVGGMRIVGTMSGNLWFTDGPMGLPTYGLAMGLGFAGAGVITYRGAKRAIGAPTGDQALELCFWILVSSILGARILYMVTQVGHYQALCAAGDCLAPLRVWEGGLVWWGGFIGAVTGGALWSRVRKIPFWKTADIVAPAAPFGHMMGRLGCFAGGCCWGSECEVPWSAQYPIMSSPWISHFEAHSDNATREVLVDTGMSLPVHPVQLYEAFGELCIFALLIFAIAPRKRFHGQVLVAYVGMYSVLRIVTELFRGDSIRGFLVEVTLPGVSRMLGLPVNEPLFLSTSQLISLVLIVVSIILTIVIRRRRDAEGSIAKGQRSEPKPDR